MTFVSAAQESTTGKWTAWNRRGPGAVPDCVRTWLRRSTADDDAIVVLLHESIPPELERKAEGGARVCPVAALRVEA